MKVAALTPEQLTQVPVWRDEWQRVEHETAPADRRRAEAAISRLDRRSGARTPAFLWVDSPLSALLAIAALHQTGEHPALKYRSEDEMGHNNHGWRGGLSWPDEHAGKAVEYGLLQKLHGDLGGGVQPQVPCHLDRSSTRGHESALDGSR